MKRLAVLLIVVLSAGLQAVAQDAPKAEIFGGYQYLNIDTKGVGDRISANGWNADLAGHLTSNFSIVADVGGVYKNGGHTYTFLFGPRISASREKLTPFAEALFGVARSGDGGGDDSNFAMVLGGGLDWNATENVAIRLAKIDYLMIRAGGTSFNNIRIAPGIVFKF